MATTRPRKSAAAKRPRAPREGSVIRWLSPEEGRQFFDEQVRRRLGISGEEFLRRWDAGEYDAIFEEPEHHMALAYLSSLIPFGR